MKSGLGARTNLRKKTASLPNYHWNTKRKGANRKQKRPFDTLELAEKVIEKQKLDDYVAYLCPYCNKWHIGYKLNTDIEPEIKSIEKDKNI